VYEVLHSRLSHSSETGPRVNISLERLMILPRNNFNFDTGRGRSDDQIE
jgi:hypothetical protein